MNFEHTDNGQKGYFRAVENDTDAGTIIYQWSDPETFVINHTNVNPEFKGRNIGKLLVLETVKFAREKNLIIVPRCPFAKSVFGKNIEIQDVL